MEMPAAPAPLITTFILSISFDNPQSVDKGRSADYRGSVLVIVEYWNVTYFLQSFLDFKASGSADVLKVDSAEASGNEINRAYDFLRILRANADGERVNTGKFLEKNAFALHNRHTGFRTDVSESENGGAVGDDRDEV